MESSSAKKRDRNANFSIKETETLVTLIEARKNVIENKKSNAVAWQDKEKAWKAIEVQFNSVGAEVYRDAKRLKVKYESMKRDVRKKLNAQVDNDVGKNPSLRFTPIDYRIQEIMSSCVKDDDSDSESDQFINQNSHDFIVQVEKVDVDEPPSPKMRCLEEDVLTPGIALGDIRTPKIWNDWKSSSSRSETRNNIENNVKAKERKISEDTHDVTEQNKDLVLLQKKLVGEQIQEKVLRKILVREEIEHKREIYKLQKEEMLLKIELLKTELQNAGQK